MWRSYSLTVGLPQTNYRNLAEAKMLMEACNFFWWALGEAVGRPVAQWRSASGEPIYATIYFVEEIFPPNRGLGSFVLDDRLRFVVGLRAIRNLSVEARVVFDREDRFAEGADPGEWWNQTPPHPVVRFGSLFATPEEGNRRLNLAAPVNANFTHLPPLPPEENPTQITREAQETGHLGVIPHEWRSLDGEAPHHAVYSIDPDRDSNAAGLVYFASYLAMMEIGERHALLGSQIAGRGVTQDDLKFRQVLRRRVAYYGNVGLFDQVLIDVSRFASPNQPDTLGLAHRVTRAYDGRLICLSEAVMSLVPPPVKTPQVALAGQGTS